MLADGIAPSVGAPHAECTMKRTPISIRIASTLAAAALAACGGGGGTDASSTPAPSPTASSPAPAATPAAAPAPAPAPTAGVAARGKTLYFDLPNTALSCEGCHGLPVNNQNNILRAAGNWQVIASAIQQNKGGMGALSAAGLSGFDMQDIAAYLATPGL
jgi:hypothetical protein